MWEVREPHAIIQAAESAAEAGNYASAEHLLREAARLQEASLGPRHPDLANTLNNLGIVCEMTGKADDAEQYFRRAVSIARTSLPPDHPFVTTSQKNLRDFCETRGKKAEMTAPAPDAVAAKVESPAPAPEVPESVAEVPEPVVVEVPEPVEEAPESVAEVPEPVAEVPQAVAEVREPVAEVPEPVQEVAKPTQEEAARQEVPAAIEEEPEDPEVTSRKFFSRLALGALGPISMLMVVLAIGLPRLGAPELGIPSPETAIDSRPEVAAQPSATPKPAPVEEATPVEEQTPTPPSPPLTPASAPAPAPTQTTKSDDHAPASARDDKPDSTARPMVVRASLCGDLDDWSCDPADRPVPPGPLFFYTQIKSPTATTVQHRWYHENRLLQAVELRVQANGASGYRTYSRNVMKSESAGHWRVELRSKDGALLHQERFSVE